MQFRGQTDPKPLAWMNATHCFFKHASGHARENIDPTSTPQPLHFGQLGFWTWEKAVGACWNALTILGCSIRKQEVNESELLAPSDTSTPEVICLSHTTPF